MTYIRLKPKSFHTLKYPQPLELVLFHVIALRIKCLKGSYYPHLLNNYLINYLNFSGLTRKMHTSRIKPLTISPWQGSNLLCYTSLLSNYSFINLNNIPYIQLWWRIILFLFKIIEYGVSWLGKLSEIPT